MAHHPHSPSQFMKKKLSGQRKKEELEREVVMLQKLLNQEEKVHEILEGVNKQQNGSALGISTNLLPPKVKELLAEVAMVESEIARLEIQITQLQKDLKSEQQQTTKSKQWSSEQPTQNNNTHKKPPLNWTNPITKATTFDTKALHFISKAIKGDYALNHFRFDAKNEDPRDRKETPLLFDQEIKVQERVPTKSGLLFTSSPFRDPPTSFSKATRAESVRNAAAAKIYANVNSGRRKHPKLAPQQAIREHHEVLKFHICEIAKNLKNNGAREVRSHFKVFAFLFELEKLSSRERLKLESSATQGIETTRSLWHLRKRRVDSKGYWPLQELGHIHVEFHGSEIDIECQLHLSHKKAKGPYEQFAKSGSKAIELPTKIGILDQHVQCLYHEWFLQYGVPSSPEKLAALLNKAMVNIGGNTINAQAIEHYILRKPLSTNREDDNKEAVVRKLYGLESSEPNVTFALCCGTRSSPAVRIYSGEAVVTELERSKLEYLQASVVVSSSRRVAVPELVVRSLPEFAAAVDMKAVVEWVCHQLPTSGSLRKSMVECFRGHPKTPPTVETMPYDFEFQYLLPL